MGGGSYNQTAARARSASAYQTKSREEVFTQRHIHPDMNPLNIKLREARDSEEHPNSYPVVIALDETGSMGYVPEKIIKHVLPDIVSAIIEAGIKDVQVCFCGVGDASTFREEAPLQPGQFESSDELIEHWLTSVYLEGLGGGNGSESYPLVWQFFKERCVTDAWEKRGMKGVIITIGDERCPGMLSKEALKRYLGGNYEADVDCKELLKEVQEKWHVFHIHCEHNWAGPLEKTNWEKYLGPNAVRSTAEDGHDVGKIIPELVINAYRTETEIAE